MRLLAARSDAVPPNPPNPMTDDPELLLLKKRRLGLLREKRDLIKDNGLAGYRPFPKQDAFHQAGIRNKRRAIFAGNRFGKSTMGCAEDCAFLMGERPWYPKDHPARRGGLPQHPVKHLLITTDWDKVDEIWTNENDGKLWKMLPSGFVKQKLKNNSGAYDTVICQNGSVFRADTVKSFKNDPQSSESSDWDSIHVDEPCPEAMWKAASRGLLDRNGSAWFTLTPLKEAWIIGFFRPEIYGEASKIGFWSSEGSTYDNPHLSKAAIEEYESTLTNDEKQCRIHGIPMHLAGLVYKEFKWEKHVLRDLPKGWDSYVNPPKDYCIYFAIDPHPQTPHAVLFCAVSPLGQRFYYDSIFEHVKINILCDLIKRRLAGRRVIFGMVDPLAYIENPVTEHTIADELGANGVYCEKAVKDLQGGIMKAQTELDREDNIYVTPTNRRFLWEIQRYAWDDKENKPVDKDDHMMENFYRLELNEPRWLNPEDETKRVIEEREPVSGRLSLEDVKFTYND